MSIPATHDLILSSGSQIESTDPFHVWQYLHSVPNPTKLGTRLAASTVGCDPRVLAVRESLPADISVVERGAPPTFTYAGLQYMPKMFPQVNSSWESTSGG
jgi:hypothetical protein